MLADPALVVLRYDARRTVVAPELGGSLVAFYDDTARGPIHWLRPTSRAALAAGDPLELASFPLFPYCNRIRDGRFTFEGVSWQLPMGEGMLRHALHGHAWKRPWQIAKRTANTVELVFRHEPSPLAGTASEPGWPFRYEARQRIVLDADGLSIHLSVCNLDTRPMPCGFGHHPYYPRSAGTRIETGVRAMWASDDALLPVALAPHPAVDALKQGLVIDGFSLDNNFTGWNREARIVWPDEHRSLTLVAEAPLDCFVLYSPSDQPFFCAEPVSNTTDWLNLDVPVADKGGCVLAPGESVEAGFAWRPSFD